MADSHGAQRTAQGVTLADGRIVGLRAIDGDDATALAEFYGRCSDSARYFRFHAPKPRLRAAEAQYLAHCDGETQVGLAATVVEDGQERLVADARFHVAGAGEADVAFLVRDDYQHAGLGRILLARLAALAADRNVHRLRLEILLENRAMLALATRLGARPCGSDGRAVVLAIDLPGDPPGDLPADPEIDFHQIDLAR